MADDLDDAVDDDLEDEGGKKAKKGGMLVPVLVGLVLAMGLGIGAAVAVISGVAPIPGLESGADEQAEEEEAEPEQSDAVAFVEFEEPLELSIGRGERAAQLRLRLSIETTEHYLADVEAVRPRILDALNTLLRAIDPRDLAEPRALENLRAQMLRRVRLAADPTAIRNLLITEYFVY